MNQVTTVMKFEDIAMCIWGLAEDNELYTVEDLYDYLMDNSEMAYSVTTITRGESTMTETNAERLEEIKDILESVKHDLTIADSRWWNFDTHDIEELVSVVEEQAERVQELEEFKEMAERLYKNYHLSAKMSVEEKENLHKQNQRYREALEFYADRHNYKLIHFNNYMSTVDYDEGQTARKALRGGANG